MSYAQLLKRSGWQEIRPVPDHRKTDVIRWLKLYPTADHETRLLLRVYLVRCGLFRLPGRVIADPKKTEHTTG